jgi:hypothetical protein
VETWADTRKHTCRHTAHCRGAPLATRGTWTGSRTRETLAGSHADRLTGWRGDSRRASFVRGVRGCQRGPGQRAKQLAGPHADRLGFRPGTSGPPSIPSLLAVSGDPGRLGQQAHAQHPLNACCSFGDGGTALLAHAILRRPVVGSAGRLGLHRPRTGCTPHCTPLSSTASLLSPKFICETSFGVTPGACLPKISIFKAICETSLLASILTEAPRVPSGGLRCWLRGLRQRSPSLFKPGPVDADPGPHVLSGAGALAHIRDRARIVLQSRRASRAPHSPGTRAAPTGCCALSASPPWRARQVHVGSARATLRLSGVSIVCERR